MISKEEVQHAYQEAMLNMATLNRTGNMAENDENNSHNVSYVLSFTTVKPDVFTAFDGNIIYTILCLFE